MIRAFEVDLLIVGSFSYKLFIVCSKIVEFKFFRLSASKRSLQPEISFGILNLKSWVVCIVCNFVKIVDCTYAPTYLLTYLPIYQTYLSTKPTSYLVQPLPKGNTGSSCCANALSNLVCSGYRPCQLSVEGYLNWNDVTTYISPSGKQLSLWNAQKIHALHEVK